MILDYSEFETESSSSGIVNFVHLDNRKAFFAHDHICPFCKTTTSKAYAKQKKDYPEWLFGSFDEFESVYQCPNCGWWEYHYSNQSDAIIDGIRASDNQYSSAIIKKYNVDSISVPIAALRSYIEKHPDAIYKIDAYKMEELVRSVFSDIYPSCTVMAFGKTRDGGKDGLLIDDDGDQYIIQVKRRSNPNATEGIGPVRELMGASLDVDNVKGCLFVSTADHFSHDAKTYANHMIERACVEKYDLIDCKAFLKMVNITRTKQPTYWEQLLRL